MRIHAGSKSHDGSMSHTSKRQGGGRVGRRSVLAIFVLVLALVPLSAQAGSDTYSLLVSKSPNRSTPVQLAGQTVSGNIYVFTSPSTGAKKVSFYLDDPTMSGAPRFVEKSAPHDFNGTAADKTAIPFHTATIANGSHTITAKIERTDGLIDVVESTFEVQNTALVLSAKTMSFAREQGAAPSTQTVDVATNDGGTPAFTATDDAPWLTVAPTSGQVPGNLSLTADPAGLAVGEYRATVTVSANGYDAARLPVTLTVTEVAPPVSYALLLSRAADRSSPTPLEGQSVANEVYVFTTPDTNVSRVRFYLDDPNMTGAPRRVETGGPFDFNGTAANGTALPFNTGALSDGSHTITAALDHPNGTTDVVSATFTSQNDRVVLSPDSVGFAINHGGSAASRSVDVATSGGAAAGFSVAEDSPWLTVSPASGTAPDAVSLTADPAGLAPGRYRTTVTVAAPGLYPATLPVTLDVEHKLLVSMFADRTAARPLEGEEVWGDVYIFAEPEAGAADVRFFIDDPNMTGPHYSSEGLAPWDLAGTASSGKAKPFDTTTLADGVHTVTIEAKLAGQLQVVSSSFEVINGAPGLTFAPESLTFRLEQGETLTQRAQVSTPDGSATSFTVGEDVDVPWLDVSPLTGSTPAELAVRVNTTGLAVGVHRAVVRASSAGFRAATLPVEVRVGCPPVPCDDVLVDLPYELDFAQDEGNIADANGVGTGFSWIDWPSNGTGYIPENLRVDDAAGVLRIKTTRGVANGASNSLDNGLAVGVDAPSQITAVTGTILNLPAGTGKFEQAGLWFGNDEDNHLKLITVSTPEGMRIESLLEVNGAKVTSKLTAPLQIAGAKVTLSLFADPSDQTISAFYRLNDGGTTSLGTFTAPPEFFSFDAARIDPRIGTDTFAGIYASHRNGSQLEYSFDFFGVTEGLSTEPPSAQGITFDRKSFLVGGVTSMAWGPDGRLYVTEMFGDIHAITLGPGNTPIADEVYEPLGARLTLGIAVDPASTPDNVILWVSHSDPAIIDAPVNSSMVSRLSGPNFATREDVITGLPRSKANHSVNSLHFGPDGRLYVAQSGNTGAGGRDPNVNAEFGDRQEQPLSAAILVADVKAAGFDGSCHNEIDVHGPAPCDVSPYATGLRNPYDFTFHSNGSMYATDNGLGVGAVYPPSPTAPCTGFGSANPSTQPDILVRVLQGKYYGHPNPSRDECVFKDGSFQGVPPLPNYEHPVLDLGDHRSANGIIEYTSDAFCGELKGGLLIANYSVGDDLTWVRLADGGTTAVSSTSLVGDFDEPLPLVQGPNGEIFVGELSNGRITVLTPIDLGCWTSRSELPTPTLDAAGTAVGGKLYVVAGKTESGTRSTMHVYDPGTDSWSAGPDLPGEAVENPAAVGLDGKLYVFGGSTGPFSGAVSNAAVFDPGDQSWTTLDSMPTARGGATAQLVGGKIYVAGGMGANGGSLATVDVYDPATDSWSTAASMGTARDNPGSAAIDGKLYVFGGRTRTSDGSTVAATLTSGEAYDPATDTWSSIAPMPTGRRTMVVGQLNGRAQVIGGEVNPDGMAFTENEEYDPATNTWRTLKRITTGRHGAVAGTIDGVIYVVGGGPVGGTSFTGSTEAFAFGPGP
jgi:large repetitive protein